ncbi:hypothetical protein DFP72DRAFT_1041099 [Ephemerocybe angulata]|uniref:Chromatin target of PRMT1 protein C-terminal domain-containing protein n=1 Tax=Ephemerocybe angulata TaxID=980116 RepID=A0A8H6IBH6_9AGAR|nr:hypothetical protein DFP72DRAFT_1041099 [Tulosesus angulatus]
MDVLIDDGIGPTSFGSTTDEPQPELLSYDDVPYEEQVAASSSLADRIGKGKVYLLADASGERGYRQTPCSFPASPMLRRAQDGSLEDDTEMMEDDTMESDDLDPDLRPNALYFSGPPIAHLPTQRIFAYATHFDAHPLGLEWISDTSCVLVFSNRPSAQKAFKLLARSSSLEESSVDDDGTIAAKSIPVPIWPAEKQLSRSLEMALLGQGKASAATTTEEKRASDRKRREEGLAGPLRMRWARRDDVKKRGAKRESEFYRRHGVLVGKEVVNGRDIPNANVSGGGSSRKRGREEEEEEEDTRARLDRELDAFLEEKEDGEGEGALVGRMGQSSREVSEVEEELPASPPSKMRSDYIASDGRTRVDRSSGRRSRRDERGGSSWGHGRDSRRGEGLSLRDRIGGASQGSWGRDEGRDYREPKRRRGGDGTTTRESREPRESGSDSRRGAGRSAPRPRKTQQELDDELDAFLNAS